MKEAVVFLASGGLDSSVGMAKAMEEQKCVVYPLYVMRGAIAEAEELSSLRRVHAVLYQKYRGQMMPLSIANSECPLKPWKTAYPREQVERLGYPMRDLILQSLGVQYAEYLNITKREQIRTVMVGQTSDEVLPHGSTRALTLASYLVQVDRDDEAWQIQSPWLRPELLTKTQVVKWAMKHDFPIELTWSCFESGPEPCGECQECVRRERAIAEARLIHSKYINTRGKKET